MGIWATVFGRANKAAGAGKRDGSGTPPAQASRQQKNAPSSAPALPRASAPTGSSAQGTTPTIAKVITEADTSKAFANGLRKLVQDQAGALAMAFTANKYVACQFSASQKYVQVMRGSLQMAIAYVGMNGSGCSRQLIPNLNQMLTSIPLHFFTPLNPLAILYGRCLGVVFKTGR
jgi:hypothetical protein